MKRHLMDRTFLPLTRICAQCKCGFLIEERGHLPRMKCFTCEPETAISRNKLASLRRYYENRDAIIRKSRRKYKERKRQAELFGGKPPRLCKAGPYCIEQNNGEGVEFVPRRKDHAYHDPACEWRHWRARNERKVKREAIAVARQRKEARRWPFNPEDIQHARPEKMDRVIREICATHY